MSNSNGNAVAHRNGFAIEMPDQAPALGFDPNLESFNWREVYPSNYWNMTELEERRVQLGGWPVLTPARVIVKPVYDPTDYDGRPVPQDELVPKLVIEFVEAVPALVMNKSRCEKAAEITGTPNPALWAARLPRLELRVGVFNRKAQIIFEPAPAEPAAPNEAVKSKSTEDLIEDLF